MTVTLDANGGTFGAYYGDEYRTYGYEGMSCSLVATYLAPTPMREGYRFDGWFDEWGWSCIDDDCILTAEMTRWYAHWVKEVDLATALDTDLPVSTGGDSDWFGQTGMSSDGQDAARSGGFSYHGSNWIEVVTHGCGRLRFAWAMDGYAPLYEGDKYKDELIYLTNGVRVCSIEGTQWWTQEDFVVTGEICTNRWLYVKNGLKEIGANCAWVDNLAWYPGAAGDETVTTPVPVKHKWLDQFMWWYGYEDYEGIAKEYTGKVDASGEPLQVWQDYVMGTDPTRSDDMLKVNISMTNGTPYITWSPDLNTNGVVRLYKIWGKVKLADPDEAWTCPTNALHRFFKVSVEMP